MASQRLKVLVDTCVNVLRQLAWRKQGVAKRALIRFGTALEDSGSDLAELLRKIEGLVR